MTTRDSDGKTFEAEDVALQSGALLDKAVIAYRTYGRLSEAKDNLVLFPTWFSSQLRQNEWLIGEGRPLDPRRHFIVSVGLLGNGQSSSPSNTPGRSAGPAFPPVSLLDNVLLQHRLLAQEWGIERIALVIGRSMGAQIAFQWGARFPDMVARMLPFSGSAKTTPHNYVFLDGVKAALTADQDWMNGSYTQPPLGGLRAIGRLYAGWALSPAYYRKNLHLAEGDSTLDGYLRRRWEGNFLAKDANDLLCQLGTWQRADISDNDVYKKDWPKALRSIKARAIVMPCRSDMFFPPEDSAAAVAHMPNAELRIIESDWGHRAAAANSDPADIAFLEAAIRELLETR